MKLFFSGVNDSLTLLAFRYSSLHWGVKVLATLFFLLSFVVIGGAAMTNQFVRYMMSMSAGDTPGSQSIVEAQSFIQTYLQLYTSGDAQWLIALAVGFLISSVLFVPFSGYVIHGVISNSEMVIVKNNNNYRIGDSFVFQMISSFTLVQLVGVTVAAQLITFDKTHSALAVFFSWAIWLLISLITVAFSWLLEYVARKFGAKMRFLFLSVFVIGIAAVIFFDPDHGATLFGAADPIYDFVNEIATGNLPLFFGSLVIVAGICLAMTGLISLMASQALKLPEPLSVVSGTTEVSQKKGGTNPISPFLLLFTTMFRHKTVIKPVLVAVGFSIVIVLLLKGQTGITTTMIVLPLAVGISLGANVFGLLSGASNWLLSFPTWRKRSMLGATGLIFLVILVSYSLVYGIGVITQAINIDSFVGTLIPLFTISIVTTVVSLYLSIKRPLPFSGKARENLISSPAALILYVLIYMLTAGLAGNLVVNTPIEYQAAFAGVIAIICIIAYVKLYRKWVYQEVYIQKMLNMTNAG